MALHVAALLLAYLAPTLALPHSPAALNPRASSGCGKSAFLPGITQYRFGLKSAGHDRSYSYHLPSSYDKNKAYPIVIGFHGSSSIGLFLEADTKLSEAQYSGDKIMIYPNGIDGSWAGASYHKGSSVADDIQFAADIITDVKSKFCVDEDKVFALGFSNGGGFIGTIACDPQGSSLFNALAAHSGSFYTDNDGPNDGCAPSKRIPMIEIHGTDDKTVNCDGGKGEGGIEPPISSWLDWWAQRNQCSDPTEEDIINGKVHHYSWTCGGTAGLLQHYKVDGLGHCWADTEINFSQLTIPQGPSVIRASEVIMDFFDSVG